MDTTKKKIENIVKDYIKKYPAEYELLKEAIKMKRIMNKEGFDKQTDMRPLFELSETLQSMIITGLEDDEITWFKTKNGGNWFSKEFKVFSLI